MNKNVFAALDRVSSVTQELRAGQILVRQGDAVDDVYAITNGYLKFMCVNADGAATITAILDAGQLFGAGLSGVGTAAHTVSAKGSATVRRWSQASFQNLVASEPDLAQAMITMLARRNALVERRLHAVLHLDVRGRIAVVLNDLSRHYGGRCTHGHQVDVPLTQQELAELVGASRSVVSSRLNTLRRAGVLAYSGGYICVNNAAALQSLAASEVLSE